MAGFRQLSSKQLINTSKELINTTKELIDTTKELSDMRQDQHRAKHSTTPYMFCSTAVEPLQLLHQQLPAAHNTRTNKQCACVRS